MKHKFYQHIHLFLVISLLLMVSCGKQEVPIQTSDDIQEESQTIEVKEEVDPIFVLVEQMSIEEKLTQMMMPSFRYWGGGDVYQKVTTLNDDLSQFLETYSFGGVILFDENMEQIEQTKTFISNLQQANQKGEAISQLIIGVDQEGGATTRIPFGSQTVGAMALAATNNPSSATKTAKLIGSELKE